MPLVSLIVLIVVVGVVLWLVETFIPMDAKVKLLLQVVVVIVLLLYVLAAFGILPALNSVTVPRVR